MGVERRLIRRQKPEWNENQQKVSKIFNYDQACKIPFKNFLDFKEPNFLRYSLASLSDIRKGIEQTRNKKIGIELKMELSKCIKP